jgi:hypothetical protein
MYFKSEINVLLFCDTSARSRNKINKVSLSFSTGKGGKNIVAIVEIFPHILW